MRSYVLIPALFAGCLGLLAQSKTPQKAPAKPAAAAKSAFDKAALETYLRHAELWIPQVDVKIDDPKPSADLAGYSDVWVHLSYNGGTKDEIYYVSKDGQKIIKGTVYDFGRSPFQSNIDKLRTDQAPAYGAAADAPVTLVVFSDFQCPVCQQEETILRSNIPTAFPGKVRVYFKDFPLDAIHPWARTASIAGRCMYSQSPDLFWNYHDWIYKNQNALKEDGSDAKQKILDYAGTNGADGMLLGRCLDDKTTASAVQKSVDEGHLLQVSATPTLFLNGRKLEGAVDLDTLKALIQIEIDAKAKTVASAKEECCVVNIPKVGK